MKVNINRSALLLLFAAAASASLNSCTNSEGSVKTIVKKGDPIPVRIAALAPVAEEGVVHASGKVTTDNEAILGFKVGGVIARLSVSEGDRVAKGQVLGAIDLREIDAIVTQAQLGYNKAERDFQRVSNLFKDSVATLESLQNAETALQLAKQQLQSANVNKQYSTIIAPYDGFVLKKFVNEGQVIGVGDPVLKVNKTDAGEWILRVNASDREWATIKAGDKAEVTLDAFPGRVVDAKVLRKSESTDAATGTFSIDLLLQQSNGLASGMFGTAKIFTGKKATTWQVPFEAVLDADGNKGFIFVTSDLKTAIKVPVTIASFNEERVSIAEGLEGYKALIVSGSAYLTDKSEITVIK